MANSVLFWFWPRTVFWTVLIVTVRTDTLNDCPSVCSCLGSFVDCSEKGLAEVPSDLPEWVENLELRNNKITYFPEDAFRGLNNLEKLDLSSNELRSVNTSVFSTLPRLKELKLDNNQLTDIPNLGSFPTLSILSLSHNAIPSINASALLGLSKLRSLILSHNHLVEINSKFFLNTSASLHSLNLVGNHIMHIEHGSLDSLIGLVDLKLSRNRLHSIPKKIFSKLVHLRVLDLSRNKITKINGLTFDEGLSMLQVLKLRRNGLETLGDGAFYGLDSLQELYLDENHLSVVSKNWLYWLSSLRHLNLANNRVARIDDRAWEFCKQLQELDLRHNALEYISKGTWSHLSKLRFLYLDNNRISTIEENSFIDLTALEELEINNNDISWVVEDMPGIFQGLSHLTKLELAANHITSIHQKAFAGLEQLKQLDLTSNNISTIQQGAFSSLYQLEELKINTSHLLCDCHLEWFPMWLSNIGFIPSVGTKCGHPQWMRGQEVTEVPIETFICEPGDSPKPKIVEGPVTTVALKGHNVTLVCRAESTSDGSLRFQWKKGNRILQSPFVVHSARTKANAEGIEITTQLWLENITHSHEGMYQCVVSNDFGTTYSDKVNVTVLVFPAFIKKPANVTLQTGMMARLECAARGHPYPEVSWRKDGGDDFPAARERRMHVMPTDDVFFIMNVKDIDMGVYSCTAQNAAGIAISNATLTVQELPSFVKPMENKETIAGDTAVLECMAAGFPKPNLTWTKDAGALRPTERHFFTADNQLLIIVQTKLSDAGSYECAMSNEVGIKKGTSKLRVSPPHHPGDDTSMTNGIIVIVVVICIVVTSMIWVVIIYQTRKKPHRGLPTSRTINAASVTADGRHPSEVIAGEDGPETALIKLPYPPTTIIDDFSSKLFLDTNSEHSSGKDSGTGDSAKRSSDDLLPADNNNGEQEDEQELMSSGGSTSCLYTLEYPTSPTTGSIRHVPQPSPHHPDTLSIVESPTNMSTTTPLLKTFHPNPHPTNHEWLNDASTNYRWSQYNAEPLSSPTQVMPSFNTLPKPIPHHNCTSDFKKPKDWYSNRKREGNVEVHNTERKS